MTDLDCLRISTNIQCAVSVNVIHIFVQIYKPDSGNSLLTFCITLIIPNYLSNG